MLKSAFSSPKIRGLAARLGIPFPHAIGICGMLWNFTADHAPQGDVGRHDDFSIAIAVEWAGDPAVLVRALVAVRLLDECPRHRLRVHDWAEHCPRYVHAKLARTGKEVLETPEDAPVATIEPTVVATVVRTAVATTERTTDPSIERTTVATTSSSSSSLTSSSSNKSGRAKRVATTSGVGWTPEDGFTGIDLFELGWRKAFPAIDIAASLARAHEWLLANEKRRKKNYIAFIVRWLGNDQDKATSKASRKPPRKGW